MSNFVDMANEYFYYCDEQKTLRWKKKPKQSRVNVGDVAGRVASPNGVTEHYRIGIKGNVYFGHKLAWAVHFKEDPPKIIDHINGDGLDNSKANLAASSFVYNNKNKRLHKRNETGVHGVFLRVTRGLYEVTIGKSGKTVYVGSSKDFFEACCMRKSMENKLCYSQNHGL